MSKNFYGEHVLESLCVKDKRNPNYYDVYYDDDEPNLDVKCSCDNCFYGRTRLALEIIKLKDELNEYKKWDIPDVFKNGFRS